ncbi:hypothetical protein JW887_04490 [Candidatus Dojkabacteria bacterium]|nr:hypothetical protein [Candidatus Dojkabacteria bacterium]
MEQDPSQLTKPRYVNARTSTPTQILEALERANPSFPGTKLLKSWYTREREGLEMPRFKDLSLISPLQTINGYQDIHFAGLCTVNVGANIQKFDHSIALRKHPGIEALLDLAQMFHCETLQLPSHNENLGKQDTQDEQSQAMPIRIQENPHQNLNPDIKEDRDLYLRHIFLECTMWLFSLEGFAPEDYLQEADKWFNLTLITDREPILKQLIKLTEILAAIYNQIYRKDQTSEYSYSPPVCINAIGNPNTGKTAMIAALTQIIHSIGDSTIPIQALSTDYYGNDTSIQEALVTQNPDMRIAYIHNQTRDRRQRCPVTNLPPILEKALVDNYLGRDVVLSPKERLDQLITQGPVIKMIDSAGFLPITRKEDALYYPAGYAPHTIYTNQYASTTLYVHIGHSKGTATIATLEKMKTYYKIVDAARKMEHERFGPVLDAEFSPDSFPGKMRSRFTNLRELNISDIKPYGNPLVNRANPQSSIVGDTLIRVLKDRPIDFRSYPQLLDLAFDILNITRDTLQHKVQRVKEITEFFLKHFVRECIHSNAELTSFQIPIEIIRNIDFIKRLRGLRNPITAPDLSRIDETLNRLMQIH